MSSDSTDPVVQFARFVDGRVELFRARTSQTSYFAISHVWGKVEWLKVKGIQYEILASPQKARFIEQRLAGLVGNSPFWMDTLTVNQKDRAEVLSTVQAMPTIFRNAVKTIAIRESSCFRKCCFEAIKLADGLLEVRNALFNHLGRRHEAVMEDPYLQRLWTLYECALSHTIEFATSVDSVDTSDHPTRIGRISDDLDHIRGQRTKEAEAFGPYHTLFNIVALIESLLVQAHTFVALDIGEMSLESRCIDFIRKFISGGTISKTIQKPRNMGEDIYDEEFRTMHLPSNREATMSRDYVFATMPQFPWYHYPQNANEMSSMTFLWTSINQPLELIIHSLAESLSQ